eukprot:403375273
MQRYLHIYPSLIVLSYFRENQSIQSQLLNKQQREFVVKKVRQIFPNIQYTIDLDTPNLRNIKDSRILSIASNLCFKILNKTPIELLQQILLELIDPEDYSLQSKINNVITTIIKQTKILRKKLQQSEIEEQNQESHSPHKNNSSQLNQTSNFDYEKLPHTSSIYILQSLKNPDYTLKKITQNFSEISTEIVQNQWRQDYLTSFYDFLIIPELIQYFQIIGTVFNKCDLVIDKGFFSRVLDVPQVQLISSNLNCKCLKKKLENIEYLAQEEGSNLNQKMKKQFFSNVKQLDLVNNVENGISQKYPNIEYLYIDEQKREQGKIFTFAPKNYTFKHLKEVYLDKKATDTSIEFIIRKVNLFSNVEKLYMRFKRIPDQESTIKEKIKWDTFDSQLIKIGKSQKYIVYERGGDGINHLRSIIYH